MDDDPKSASAFGAGQMPPDLDRLNWGAFLLAPAWAFVHGIWSWTAVFVLVAVLRYALVVSLSRGLIGMASWAQVLLLGVGVASLLVTVVFGFRANPLAWRKSHARLARSLEGGESVARYVLSQRRWAAAGLVWWALSYALTWSSASAVSRVLVPGSLLALFLFDRWYRSRRAIEQAHPADFGKR